MNDDAVIIIGGILILLDLLFCTFVHLYDRRQLRKERESLEEWRIEKEKS